jgi:hypothetical protein
VTWDEFVNSMSVMESQLIVSDEQKINRQIRWQSLFRRIQGFTSREFSAAIESLLDDNKFVPARMEFVEACEEARESLTPIRAPERKTFPLEEHRCAKRKEPPSDALRQLAAIAPYEATHIFCKGKIHATCPACGARHLDTAILEGIAKLFPADQVKGWNTHFKGLTLCPDCEVKNDAR